MADLVMQGQRGIVAKGGVGGWGNKRFATPERRAPRIAQRGQAGKEKRLVLDLKLLADVGLVGRPNAGKSTLLRTISHARPAVAQYPFTTLEPVLGVVERGVERFIVAEVPGLIGGAHQGAGLGLTFLRHIERTSVILHLLDGSRLDLLGDMEVVNRELRQYSEELAGRQQIVAVNKVDLVEVRERRVELERAFAARGIQPRFVSGATGEGLDDLIVGLVGILRERAAQISEVSPRPVKPEGYVPRVMVRREDGAFRVESGKVVTFTEMMPVEQEEARVELWRWLERWGVTSALRRAGAKPGDRVRLGRVELEWRW